MEFFIQADALTATILEDLIAEKPHTSIEFKITPVDSTTHIEERLDQLQDVDGRKHLNFFDLSTFFVALSIPASYILMKLADAVLEELGKSLAQFLRESWKRRQKSKQPASLLYVVLEIGEANYILSLDQEKILIMEEMLPLAFNSASDHWTLMHEQPLMERSNAYSLVFEEKYFIVKSFDPFV